MKLRRFLQRLRGSSPNPQCAQGATYTEQILQEAMEGGYHYHVVPIDNGMLLIVRPTHGYNNPARHPERPTIVFCKDAQEVHDHMVSRMAYRKLTSN